jgi:hypothetical protein
MNIKWLQKILDRIQRDVEEKLGVNESTGMKKVRVPSQRSED